MAARTRSGADLIDDAYKRADLESATDRHPRASVLRYVNQGGAELWDLLIEARGPEYFRATPQTITTTTETTSYALNPSFYMLISARWEDEAGFGDPLVPFDGQEEPALRDRQLNVTGYPSNYQLRRTVPGTDSLEVLPEHRADLSIIVEYVPCFTDLTDASSSYFYGVNGWEEYIVDYAARKMATKDEEWPLVRELDADMAMLRKRILNLAPKRDMHRARRVKDVRGPLMMGRRYG